METELELLGMCGGDVEDGGAVGEPSLLFCSSIDSEALTSSKACFCQHITTSMVLRTHTKQRAQ